MEQSYYERLPIYKTAMQLLVNLDVIVRSISRYHRYSIGAQMRSEAFILIRLVVQANRSNDRAQKVLELCEHLQEMRLICNIAKEVQAFQSFDQFMLVMEQVINLTRQAEGWRKSLLLKRPETLR